MFIARFPAAAGGRLYLGVAAVLMCAVSSTAPTPVQGARLIQGTHAIAGDCPPDRLCSGGAGVPGGWGGPADTWQAFTISPPAAGTDGVAAASGAWVEVPAPAAAAPAGIPPVVGGVPSGTVTGPMIDLSAPPNPAPAYDVITIGPPQPQVAAQAPAAPPAAPAAPPAAPAASPAAAAPPVSTAPQPHAPSTSPAVAVPVSVQPVQAAGAPLPSGVETAGVVGAAGPGGAVPAPVSSPVPASTVSPSAAVDPGGGQPAAGPVAVDTAGLGTAAYRNGWDAPDVVDDFGSDTGQWTPALFDARQHTVPPPPGLLALGDGTLVLAAPSTTPSTGPQPSLVSVATWTPAAQQGRWEARMRMDLPPGSTAGLALAPAAATPAGATTATVPAAAPAAAGMATGQPRLGAVVLDADSLPSDLDAVDLQGWHHWAVELTGTETRTYLDGHLAGVVPTSGAHGPLQLQIQLHTSPTQAEFTGTARAAVEVDWVAHYSVR